eukprot:PhF_6_TR193/c0_g1_i1/m.90
MLLCQLLQQTLRLVNDLYSGAILYSSVLVTRKKATFFEAAIGEESESHSRFPHQQNSTICDSFELRDAIDPFLQVTQNGFIPGRGTTHHIMALSASFSSSCTILVSATSGK